jgi:signal transduction histidine kinase
MSRSRVPPAALAASAVGVGVLIAVVAASRQAQGGPWWHDQGSSPVAAVLVAALGVGLAVGPVGSRIRQRSARSRAREDGLRRVRDFLRDLRAGRAEPEAVEALLQSVMAAPSLALRLLPPDGGLAATADGRPAPHLAGRALYEVRPAGEVLAEIAYDPADMPHPDLLPEITQAATLGIEIARLRVELQRRLAEVHASRTRIVEAGDDERRRIERNLHDGAQQRLVTVGLTLRHTQHLLSPQNVDAHSLLDGAVGELAAAIDELRELASGVMPAELREGLPAALDELAARSTIPVTVHAERERFAEELEVAAYFVASEGLANAVKHSAATRVTITAQRLAGQLVVAVTDDGCGGASEAGGTGLRGLGDRVAAHGGTLRMQSEPGHGTTITAELPCVS